MTPGLTKERAGFFADAVFAIAITLLVIEIPKPESGEGFTPSDTVSKAQASRHLLDFLGEHWGAFFAYLLAFLVLWIVWREHHELFDQIDHMSPKLVAWHFPLLLVLGLNPYAVAIYGNHIGNPAAAALYTITIGLLLLVRTLMQAQAVRDGLLRNDVDHTAFRQGLTVSWAVTGYWFATLLLIWWTPWTAVLNAATPLVPVLVKALRTTRRRDAATPRR